MLKALASNYELVVAILVFVIGFCMLLFDRNLLKRSSAWTLWIPACSCCWQTAAISPAAPFPSSWTASPLWSTTSTPSPRAWC